MKKINILLSIFLLSSCSSIKETTSSLRIVCPTGAPAIAFYNEAKNPNFETNSVPSNIIAMMSDDSNKDIIVIDTVSGIKAINNGVNYKIAASITFGNFYIASTGNDENNTMDVDDKIVLFGKNQNPDYLFHYIYGTAYDSAIEWVGNVQDAAKCIKLGKNLATGSTIDYVFIAEPVLTNVKTESTTIYANIQEEYAKKSGGLQMIQASVFVNNKSSKEAVDKYLEKLENDINAIKTDKNVVKNGMDLISEEEQASIYGIKSSIAMNTIDKLGLDYKKAIDNKEAIDNFIELFGENKTNEEIYYK